MPLISTCSSAWVALRESSSCCRAPEEAEAAEAAVFLPGAGREEEEEAEEEATFLAAAVLVLALVAGLAEALLALAPVTLATLDMPPLPPIEEL